MINQCLVVRFFLIDLVEEKLFLVVLKFLLGRLLVNDWRQERRHDGFEDRLVGVRLLLGKKRCVADA